MSLELWMVGKTKVSFVAEGLAFYLNRIKAYQKMNISYIPDQKTSSKTSIQLFQEKESEAIFKQLKDNDLLVVFDEKGTQLNSMEFAKFTDHLLVHFANKRCILLIGGAYGFSDKLKARADHKIALSKMTFPHQLVRLIIVEQLYRAFTILKNESYHH